MLMSLFDWMARVLPMRTRERKPRPKGTGRKPDEYALFVGGKMRLQPVKAFTKGEARAMFKRQLGRKGRLPVGHVVRRFGEPIPFEGQS